MTKREFFAVLQRELYKLPENELKDQLSFYNEMIADGMEEGLTEEQAVAKIGSISEILSQINHEKTSYSDKSITVKKEKKKIGAGVLSLVILGSPIWISLLAAAFAVVISLYAGLWTVWVCICAAEITFASVAVAGVLSPIMFIPKGAFLASMFLFGGGLVCAGLSVFLWYGCKCTLFAFAKFTKRSFLKLISMLNIRRN